ncbi:MAG: glycosyl transferase, WecB/TagA/CpsF family [Hyphomicrobiales bacterium]|nr:glycosyl transferase, WecB/TagA/CpsF family [Hyphomicrobiales bacterium]
MRAYQAPAIPDPAAPVTAKRADDDRTRVPATVFGIPIHGPDATDIVEYIATGLRQGLRRRVLYANAHLLTLTRDNPKLTSIFREAELVVCDGYGAALAARLLCGRKLSRQSPPDWIDGLAARAAADERRVFLVGGSDTAIRKAAAELIRRHPGLILAGAMHGYFDKAVGSRESKQVVDAINASRTDILIVGFGMPIQEMWLWENWDKLTCPSAITVGAMFDFLSGEAYRAPRWVTDNGLEWASRLVTEPRRLWRRYLVGLPMLLLRVMAEKYFPATSRLR